MKKRIILIISIMIVGMLFVTFNSKTLKAEDTITTNLSGSGLKYDPYLISDIDDLDEFRRNVHSGITFENKYISLISDIAFLGENFQPIGTIDTPFKGMFYGNNYSISSTNFTVLDDSFPYLGLFGYLGAAADGSTCIVDLNLVTPQIACYVSADSPSGSDTTTQINIGLLVGRQEANTLIDNCHISGGTIGIYNRNTEKTTEPGMLYIGGLVGYSEGRIINCITEADIDVKYSYSGTFTPTDPTYTFKSYAGGIAGYTSGDITNSMVYSNYIKLEFGYGSSSISSEPIVGGIVGHAKNANIVNTYSFMPPETADNINFYIGPDTEFTEGNYDLSLAKIGTHFGLIEMDETDTDSYTDNSYNYVYGCWINGDGIPDTTKIRPISEDALEIYLLGGTVGSPDATNIIACIPFGDSSSYEIYSGGPLGDASLLVDQLGAWTSDGISLYSSWTSNTDKGNVPYLARDIDNHLHTYTFGYLSTSNNTIIANCIHGSNCPNSTDEVTATLNFDETIFDSTTESVVYTGSAIEPLDSEQPISYSIDTWPKDLSLTPTYADNINVSTDGAAIFFTYGKRMVTYSFNITAALLDETWFSVSDQYCTGEAVEPVVVDNSGKNLVLDQDYTVSYENNIREGNATVTISGINNYTGEVVLSFALTCPGHDYQHIYNTTQHWEQCIYCLEELTSENHSNYTFTKAEDAIYIKCGTCDFSSAANIITDTSVSLVYDGDNKEIYNLATLADWPDSVTISITYIDNINAGTATATFTMTDSTAGNKNSSIDFTFEITPRDLPEKWFDLEDEVYEYEYTALEVKPNVVLSQDSNLIEGTDYLITYENNTDIGEGVVVVTGNGNYQGEIRITFQIAHNTHQYPDEYIYDTHYHWKECTLCDEITIQETHIHIDAVDGEFIFISCEICGYESSTKVSMPSTSYPYNQEAIEPFTIEYGENWPDDVEIWIEYSNNINVGTAQADVYIFKKVVVTYEFTIGSVELTSEGFTIQDRVEYTGSAVYPNISVSNDFDITLGIDYTLTYSDNTTTGLKFVSVRGIGNYSGDFLLVYEIVHTEHQFSDDFEYDLDGHWHKCTMCDEVTAKENHEFSISKVGDDLVLSCTTCDYEVTSSIVTLDAIYDGTQKEAVLVSYSPTWPSSVSATITYQNNINAGTAQAYVTILDTTYEYSFEISRKALSSSSFTTVSSVEYTGEALTPSVTAVDSSLIFGTDYTISYLSNVNVGTATIVISGLGNYDSDVRITFSIIHTIHQYPDTWKSDDVYHWKECSICGAIDFKESHSGEDKCDVCSHALEKFEAKKDIVDTLEKIENIKNGDVDDPDLKEAIEKVDKEVVEEVTNKSQEALTNVTNQLDSGEITQEEAKKIIEIVETTSRVAIIIVNNQQQELTDLQDKDEESPVKLTEAVETFYDRQYQELLSFDPTISVETYNSVVEFTNVVVSNMKSAVGTIHECDGEDVHLEVNRYIESLSTKTFRDFDKEAADKEFVRLAYQAILIHMQEQTLVILEESYQEAVDSGAYRGKQLKEINRVFEESKALVVNIESFEDIVLGVLQEKYIALIDIKYQEGVFTLEEKEQLINEALDKEKFEETYHLIFESWALNKNEYEITLEELTTTVVNEYGKDTIKIEVNEELSTEEIVVVSSIGGSIGIFDLLYFILRRKVGI